MEMGWFKNLSNPVKCIVIGAGFGLAAYSVYYVHQRMIRSSNSPENKVEQSDSSDKSWELLTIPSDIVFNDIEDATSSDTSTFHSSLTEQDSSFGDVIVLYRKEPVEHASNDDVFIDQKSCRKVLLLGLEKSGKSTILSHLSKDGNRCMEYTPTKGYNVVCISYESVDLSIWEIGGSALYREYWRNFSSTADLVLFVIDSTDRDKFEQAKEYIFEIVTELDDGIEFHVVATKSDHDNSVSLDELIDILGVKRLNLPVHQIDLENSDANSGGVSELFNSCLKNLGHNFNIL